MSVVGVSDVWKMFEWANGRKAARKQAVGEWLDAVYNDLEDLAKIWRRLSASLDAAELDHEVHRAVAVIRRGDDAGSQQWLAGRLLRFYEAASTVLRGRREVDMPNNFVQSLGHVLLERRKAREVFDEHFNGRTIDPTNTELHLRDMTSAADALQREAAALQVLIKTFKPTSV